MKRSIGSRETNDSSFLADNNSPDLNKYFTDNVFLTELWHFNEFFSSPEEDPTKSTWRSKERMKTTGVALVLCLNIGTDPPGIVKPFPCARKECWLDPVVQTKQKSLEMIGNALQQQYEKWHSKAKFKQCLDPSPDDLRRVCTNLRKAAKGDRLLLHYNGHGVPTPTKNGELWVFFKNYTHYMPVTATELKSWLGEPAIYVFDCSGAGTLIPHFAEGAIEPSHPFLNTDMVISGRTTLVTPPIGTNTTNILHEPTSTSSNIKPINSPSQTPPLLDPSMPNNTLHPNSSSSTSGHDYSTIVLASCRGNEILPMNPQYPADIFTACLTTPIAMAVRWLILQNPYSLGEINTEFVDNLPGKESDRKSPRGELSWIFTTITDTIAWNTLPQQTFQKLFRQDLLVASLFRNFLLAKRVMKSFNCTPQSWPPLPDSTTHHLWQAWDLAAESCLLNTLALQKGTPMIDPRNNKAIPLFASTMSTSFFSDHLTAFEIWLDYDSSSQSSLESPTYLPILLQMLLSPTHRLRALQLLRRYLSLGSYTVNLALLVGIFPYVLKLLQNQASDIRQVLLCIWTSIIGFDISCRTELIRDKCQHNFIQYLIAKDLPSNHRCMAAFTLAEICHLHKEGQMTCQALQLTEHCISIVTNEDLSDYPDFKKWICLCLSKLIEDYTLIKYKLMLNEYDAIPFYRFLLDADPCVRAAAIIMFSHFFGVYTDTTYTPPAGITTNTTNINTNTNTTTGLTNHTYHIGPSLSSGIASMSQSGYDTYMNPSIAGGVGPNMTSSSFMTPLGPSLQPSPSQASPYIMSGPFGIHNMGPNMQSTSNASYMNITPQFKNSNLTPSDGFGNFSAVSGVPVPPMNTVPPTMRDSNYEIMIEKELALVLELLNSCTDGSVMVRREAIIAIDKFMNQEYHKTCIKLIAKGLRQHSSILESKAGVYTTQQLGLLEGTIIYDQYPSNTSTVSYQTQTATTNTSGNTNKSNYYHIYPWNLRPSQIEAITNTVKVYLDENGFGAETPNQADFMDYSDFGNMSFGFGNYPGTTTTTTTSSNNTTTFGNSGNSSSSSGDLGYMGNNNSMMNKSNPDIYGQYSNTFMSSSSTNSNSSSGSTAVSSTNMYNTAPIIMNQTPNITPNKPTYGHYILPPTHTITNNTNNSTTSSSSGSGHHTRILHKTSAIITPMKSIPEVNSKESITSMSNSGGSTFLTTMIQTNDKTGVEKYIQTQTTVTTNQSHSTINASKSSDYDQIESNEKPRFTPLMLPPDSTDSDTDGPYHNNNNSNITTKATTTTTTTVPAVSDFMRSSMPMKSMSKNMSDSSNNMPSSLSRSNSGSGSNSSNSRPTSEHFYMSPPSSSHSLPVPQSTTTTTYPNTLLPSRSYIVASNYVRLWLAIQEIYCKDPHIAVKSTAEAVTRKISRELLDDEIMEENNRRVLATAESSQLVLSPSFNSTSSTSSAGLPLLSPQGTGGPSQKSIVPTSLLSSQHDNSNTNNFGNNTIHSTTSKDKSHLTTITAVTGTSTSSSATTISTKPTKKFEEATLTITAQNSTKLPTSNKLDTISTTSANTKEIQTVPLTPTLAMPRPQNLLKSSSDTMLAVKFSTMNMNDINNNLMTLNYLTNNQHTMKNTFGNYNYGNTQGSSNALPTNDSYVNSNISQTSTTSSTTKIPFLNSADTTTTRPSGVRRVSSAPSVCSVQPDCLLPPEVILTSHFYEWNKKLFLTPDMGYDPYDDPLSVEGQARIYRNNQLSQIDDLKRQLSDKFNPHPNNTNSPMKHNNNYNPYNLSTTTSTTSHSSLSSYRTQTTQDSTNSSSSMNSSYSTPYGNANGANADTEIQSSDVKFEQKILITNKSASKTSLVMFHAFQDILVTTDGYHISVWSLQTCNRILHWNNQQITQHPFYMNPASNGINLPPNSSIQGLSAMNTTRNNTMNRPLGSHASMPNLNSTTYIRTTGTQNSSAVSVSTGTHTPSPAIPEASIRSNITTMSWINEAYDALLMVGSDDGSMKIWRDTAYTEDSAATTTTTIHNKDRNPYTIQPQSHSSSYLGYHNSLYTSTPPLSSGGGGGGGHNQPTSSGGGGNSNHNIKGSIYNDMIDMPQVTLASAFMALPDIAETNKGSGMVTSWLQYNGTLVVGGNSSSIHIWDLSREQCVRTFTTGVETCTTVLTTLSSNPNYTLSYPLSHKYKHPSSSNSSSPEIALDSVPLTWTFAGFADGSIGVFDERVPLQGGRVHLSKEHDSWIVSAHLRNDIPELITSSIKGTVKFSDLRSMRSYKMMEVQKSPISSLAVHPCAPILASGSQAQFIKVLTFQGEQLGSIIKYHDGFLGQRIGPVLSLAFHPFKLQLACGAADNVISVYQGLTESKY